jgi:hypothetical protein
MMPAFPGAGPGFAGEAASRPPWAIGSAGNWWPISWGRRATVLQANRKTREGTTHPDRDAQFRYINQRVRRGQAAAQPVVSVDTKKKELVGEFKNAGRQWRPHGRPAPVRVHDFLIPARGKAIPYGVYDLTRNAGWVSVGNYHDTAKFAARTIGRWWQKMGRPRYRHARSLLITADAGGSNGARVRLWKRQLQQLANRTGLVLTVCHFPPGTSKRNKIEHRLFSYISSYWRGQPLVSLTVIVNLIGSTRTATGLRVRCELDRGRIRTAKRSRTPRWPRSSSCPIASMATETTRSTRCARDENSATYCLTLPKA